MEEEKVKGVLDWPTPKGVKDIQKFLGLANYCHCCSNHSSLKDK